MKAGTVNQGLIQSVLQMVSGLHNVSIENFVGSDRKYALPRQFAAYLLKQEFGQTLRAIKNALGIKADSQVYLACAKIKKLSGDDPKVREDIDKIKASVLTEAVSELHKEPEARAPQVEETVKGIREREVAPSLPVEAVKPSEPALREPATEKRAQELLAQAGTVTEKIVKYVGEVFCPLGVLLTSRNPLAQISRAREVIAFLMWNDLDQPIGNVARTLSTDETWVYAAIGKTVVALEKDKTTKVNIKEIRSGYQRKRRKKR